MSLLIGGLVCVLLAPEGPASEASPPWREDPLWRAQRRRVRAGTIAAGSALGASALGLGISSAVLGRADGAAAPRTTQTVMAASFAVSAIALGIVGASWERLAALGERTMPRFGADPRGAAWVRRDRRLTGAMIGAGVGAGVLTIATMGTLSVWLRPCDPEMNECGDKIGPLAPLVLGVGAAVGLAGFATVAVIRAAHRKPLRRWRAELAAGGLRIRF
jgi:hypothetical protein